jgi:hypothetical protein
VVVKAPKYRVDHLSGEHYFIVAGGTFLVPRIMYSRLLDDRGETVAILSHFSVGEKLAIYEEMFGILFDAWKTSQIIELLAENLSTDEIQRMSELTEKLSLL